MDVLSVAIVVAVLVVDVVVVVSVALTTVEQSTNVRALIGDREQPPSTEKRVDQM